jgi:hypothetical protein
MKLGQELSSNSCNSDLITGPFDLDTSKTVLIIEENLIHEKILKHQLVQRIGVEKEKAFFCFDGLEAIAMMLQNMKS